MKIGVMSDIHGNYPALESILNAARKAEVERWLILGDLVGYYYWPSKCIHLLRRIDAEIIAGNHDRMTYDASKDTQLLEQLTLKYGSGSKYALVQMTLDELEWLHGLPEHRELKLGDKDILLCHGSPWGMDEYVYPDAPRETWLKFGGFGYDLIFFGHSHHATNVKILGTQIINPGSVGQPRDRKGGAQWVIWDTHEDSFEFRRESYNQELLLTLCASLDPDLSYLRTVFG